MNGEYEPDRDLFQRVSIKSPVMEAWINSLADIALTLRLHNGVKVVEMAADQAFMEKSGRLTMSTTVDGEPVRMVVPDEMWSFCDPDR